MIPLTTYLRTYKVRRPPVLAASALGFLGSLAQALRRAGLPHGPELPR